MINKKFIIFPPQGTPDDRPEEEIGVRVNPNVYFGEIDVRGTYPLGTYFWFYAANQQTLLNRIYAYFDMKGPAKAFTDNDKVYIEPMTDGDGLIAHRLYFRDSESLSVCFNTILIGYSLVDAFTEENTTLQLLYQRAKYIEAKVINNHKKNDQALEL